MFRITCQANNILSDWSFNTQPVLVNSKFGVFYSNFLSLTPTVCIVSIEMCSKTPTFSEKQHFYSYFQNHSENSVNHRFGAVHCKVTMTASCNKHTLLLNKLYNPLNLYGPRLANLVLIAYASSEGSGEPAHPRSLARTSAARSYKQWVKRNLQTESQIPGPSGWLACAVKICHDGMLEDTNSLDAAHIMTHKCRTCTYQSRPWDRVFWFIRIGPLRPDQCMFHKKQLKYIMDTNPLSTSPVNIIKLDQNLKADAIINRQINQVTFAKKHTKRLEIDKPQWIPKRFFHLRYSKF